MAEFKVAEFKGDLAECIIEWLRYRNGGQLEEALVSMTVRDAELLLEELRLILKCGGKPPNWL